MQVLIAEVGLQGRGETSGAQAQRSSTLSSRGRQSSRLVGAFLQAIWHHATHPWRPCFAAVPPFLTFEAHREPCGENPSLGPIPASPFPDVASGGPGQPWWSLPWKGIWETASWDDFCETHSGWGRDGIPMVTVASFLPFPPPLP